MAKNKHDPKQWGLTLGIFAALLHLIWAVMVAISPQGAQTYANWALSLHLITTRTVVTEFDLATAATLVVVTFVVGFVFGWLLATVANFVDKKF